MKGRHRTNTDQSHRPVSRHYPLALLVIVLLAACRDGDGGKGEPAPGKPAPAIKLETLEHQRFYLNQHRGKPVVLMFWDTSCEVCKRELVELEKLRKSLGSARVVMASVCSDPENIDLARSMVAGLSISLPTLLDHGAAVTATYGVKAFPTTFVISPGGQIIFVREGYTEPLLGQLRDTLERQLDAAK